MTAPYLMTTRPPPDPAQESSANFTAVIDNLYAAAREGRLMSIDQRTTDEGTVILTVTVGRVRSTAPGSR